MVGPCPGGLASCELCASTVWAAGLWPLCVCSCWAGREQPGAELDPNWLRMCQWSSALPTARRAAAQLLLALSLCYAVYSCSQSSWKRHFLAFLSMEFGPPELSLEAGSCSDPSCNTLILFLPTKLCLCPVLAKGERAINKN